MIIESKYMKEFISDSLTRKKYNEIYNFAVFLCDFRNKISEEVNDNLWFFLDMSKFNFVKYMRNVHYEKISSCFDYQLYTQIYTDYQNKFDAVQNNLKFYSVTFNGFEFYKKKTKNHEKGDFKKVDITKKETNLSKCLTFLARYGSNNTVKYIKSQIKSGKLTTGKIKDYNNILYCVDKFGFERLMVIAMDKRIKAIEVYSEHKIEYTSLTFKGRSRKNKIVDYNKNYNSKITAFMSLSGFSSKSFDVPVKFAKKYHGNINDFFNNKQSYEYVLMFDEKHKQVKINICKDGNRFIPENKTNYVGIDVNVKHNLFSLSNDDTYDYDRKLVNDYTEMLIEIDKLKKKDKNYKVGKRKQFKLDILRMKMKKSEQQLIADMCKDLNSKGIDHIVMEDLNNGFGKSYVKDKNNVNFNRVVSFLNLSSLKQEVEHIARNYDICVSTVQACYTSKMCPICGCIEDENRSSQEEFECVDCGHKDNADHNASINIKNRVSLTVLRNKLLKKLDNGSFEPKKLKREKVKEILLSFRIKQ